MGNLFNALGILGGKYVLRVPEKDLEKLGTDRAGKPLQYCNLFGLMITISTIRSRLLGAVGLEANSDLVIQY